MNWFPMVTFLVRWAGTIEGALTQTEGGPDYVSMADEYFDAMVPVVIKHNPQWGEMLRDLQKTLHEVTGKHNV